MSRRLALIEAGRYALAYGEPDTSALLRRIRDLEGENSGLRRQLEALGHAPAALQRVNDERQAAATRLQEAIAAALAREADPEAVSAKQVMKALARAGWTELPSVRTVQRHLDALRHSAHVARGA